MKLLDKGISLCKNIVTYWKKPPQGRYMPYREIVSLAVGSFGAKFVLWGCNSLLVNIGNAFVCNTIGVGPIPVYVIWLLSTLSGFPLTALRAKMIDSTRSMKGKYRPYILSMGLPTAVLTTVYVLFPYERVHIYATYAFLLLCNIGFQFFYNFFLDVNDSIINVLSPNTFERSDVISVKTVMSGLAPSICTFVMPLAAKMITGENTLYDIRVYRAVFPVMMAVGFGLSIFIYANTEEKIVQAKLHIIQMKFTDALRAVAGNKYFWVISLAGWLGFLEGTANSVIGWMYNYQQVCTPGQYSLIVTIMANASFWPMLIAPYLTRRYGKRSILLVTNFLNILFFASMLLVVRQTASGSIIWLLMVCMCANNFITTLSMLLLLSINADVRDYQQYISGERIDGMFAAVGMIGTVVTLATSFVLPMLYDIAGLNETVARSLGFDGSNVYDVLYDQTYFIRISSVLVIASVVGATLNVIPYFFYDLTETRQKGIVAVLKIRAMFEDYSNHILQTDKLGDAVEIIKEAQSCCDRTPLSVKKADIRHNAIDKSRSAVKKAVKAARAENEKTEIARFVMQELTRFDTPEGQEDIRTARRIVDAGLEGYLDVEMPSRAQIRKMPHTTPTERERRRSLLTLDGKIRSARKAVQKYFPNGVHGFDSCELESLFKAEDAAEQQLHNTMQALKQAKTQKEKDTAATLKAELKTQRLSLRRIRSQANKASEAYTMYYRAVQPYWDAQKLLLQQENYTHLEEILAQYESEQEKVGV